MDRQPVSESETVVTVLRRWNSHVSVLLLAAVLMTGLSGCKIVLGVMQIFQGFPKTPSDFWVKTHHRSLAEKGKRVVVLSTSTPSAQSEEPSLDFEIIDSVSRRFKVENIKVVQPDKVSRWIDDHGQIGLATALDPIAKEFKADFIVLFSFEEFGYHEENSPSMYRGFANGRIVVTEMVTDGDASGKKHSKIIYNSPFTMKYPGNRSISVDQTGEGVFKRKFMSELTDFLVRKFVEYRPEEEIQ